MAETADVLSSPDQKVMLPNLTAGCSMADMADIDDVLDCWEDLEGLFGNGGVVPITYMNSTAAIKSLCGRNNGIVCTSSNATATFEWAFSQSDCILFLPDQHLGRNTALKLGIGLDEMLVWNPFKPLGGHSEDELRRAKVILWQAATVQSTHGSTSPRLRRRGRSTPRSTSSCTRSALRRWSRPPTSTVRLST